MRRVDKKIKDSRQINAIMKKASCCRIALVDGIDPYVVPVNFAVSNKHLYFHSAAEGRKIGILRKNNRVCFEIDLEEKIVKGDKPCNWGTQYKSVIGFGKAFFIENEAGKKKALNVLMEKFAGGGSFVYSKDALSKVAVIAVKIEKITGKKSG